MKENKLDLSGKWLLRWADGERGGLKFHSDVETDTAKWMDAEVPELLKSMFLSFAPQSTFINRIFA